MSPKIQRRLPFLGIVVIAALGLSYLAYTYHAEHATPIKPTVAAVSKTKVAY